MRDLPRVCLALPRPVPHPKPLTLRPTQAFFDLGICNVVRLMFKDKDFVKQREKYLADRELWKDDFYGSACARAIDEKTGGQLFFPDNGVYELGHDFGEMFSFKSHSSGLICIR